MAFSLQTLMDRYAGRGRSLPSLDLLASSVSHDQPLVERLNWLVDVVQWIRRPGQPDDTPAANASLQSGRLRRFLDFLERNPEWKLSVARALRSIVRQTRAVALFSETGLPRQFGFLSEFGERLTRKLLPAPLASAELGVLFDRLFPCRGDDVWIANLDSSTLDRLAALLEFSVDPSENGWNTLPAEMQDALAYIAAQIRVTGCSMAIRDRLKHDSVRDLLSSNSAPLFPPPSPNSNAAIKEPSSPNSTTSNLLLTPVTAPAPKCSGNWRTAVSAPRSSIISPSSKPPSTASRNCSG